MVLVRYARERGVVMDSGSVITNCAYQICGVTFRLELVRILENILTYKKF